MASRTSGSRPSPARERLLETASHLFYQEGIHTVGIDRVIAEAGVTRATFYRHFPSKEDLVRTYLQSRDELIRVRMAEAVQQPDTPPRLLLIMLMGGIVEAVCGPEFRGCPFINASAEYPDPDSLVHRAVQAHRGWFRETVSDLARAAGYSDPDHVTQALIMLRDGAMAGGYLDDARLVREHLRRATEAFLPI